jgi:hypothetical protein
MHNKDVTDDEPAPVIAATDDAILLTSQVITQKELCPMRIKKPNPDS